MAKTVKNEELAAKVELNLKPLQSPLEIIESQKIVIPEDRVYGIIDTGTRREKYVFTTGASGCLLNIAGTPQNESAREKIGMEYALGNLVHEHAGRFVEQGYDDLKTFDDGVLKTEAGKVPETVEKKAIFLLEYNIGQGVDDKDKELWLTMAVPPGTGMESLPHYVSIVRKYNEKRDGEGSKRKLPYIKALMVRSQPEMLGKGLGLDYSQAFQIGAGTISGEASYGIDKQEEFGEMPNITVKGAGDWADQLLLEQVRGQYKHANVTLDEVRAAKEQRGFVGKPGSPIYVTSGSGRRAMKIDITDNVRDVCEKLGVKVANEAIIPLVERVPKELQDRVVANTIVGGGGSAIRGLKDFVQQRAEAVFPNVGITVLEDKVYGECINSLAYVASKRAESQYETEL